MPATNVSEEQFIALCAERERVQSAIADLQGQMATFEVALAASVVPIPLKSRVYWTHNKANRSGILLAYRVVANAKTDVQDDIQYTIKAIKKDGTEGDDLVLYQSTLQSPLTATAPS